MATARWTPTAKRELDDFHDFLGVERQSPQAAAHLVAEIHEKANLYATQPDMGTLREDLGEGLRIFSVKSYIVVYRAIRHGIEVLRVVDGRRDYPGLFR
jgi:plasmid stabilization system protein ParE